MKEINHRGHREELSVSLCSPKEYPLKGITGRIISCCMEVHSILGPGLLESVYEEALSHEFDLRGIEYRRQKAINCINHRGHREELSVFLCSQERMRRLFLRAQRGE